MLTDVVVKYASKELEVNSGAFVDDFLNARAVIAHGECEGLEGGCPVCESEAEAAQPVFDALDRMMTVCALVFSTKGDMAVRQRHIFLGIIFDTFRGRIYITKE